MVTNIAEKAAESKLEAAGLQVGKIIRRQSDDIKKGGLLRQNQLQAIV